MVEVWALVAGLLVIGTRELFATLRHVASVRAAERVALSLRPAEAWWCCAPRGTAVLVMAHDDRGRHGDTRRPGR
ncbi:hypothetical protein AB0M46_08305 [Dactylosporangium sp. NPDC051485]|uniref:hypothetical protein n=1 Tax=Dactylosporangium sp. NPDC051485 TaxID=3154846 RepID=UPI003422FCAD